MSITVGRALLAVIAVVFPSIARAADQSPFDDTVFGNWGGLRGGLYDDGIALGIEYKSETASNVRGGPRSVCATQTNGRSAQSLHVPET
jgi:carbohydrate-selective porin OprB